MAQLDNSPMRTGLLDFIQKSSGTQFVIPVYQRNYTWTAKQETGKLLSDIDAILEGKAQSHFMGIIMYLSKSITFSFHQLLIVDGQQRLTTFFLILLAVRQYAKETGNEQLMSIINDQYMFNKFVDDGNKLRLKPLVNDDYVYQKLVAEQLDLISAREKESNVYRNFEAIYNWLLQKIPNYSLDTILSALDKLHIVCIPLIDSDNAQQIFESINSTGVPLTSADLIRNFILMNFTNEEQEHYYTTYWKVIESLHVGQNKLEEFFRFYLAVKAFTLFNKRDVYVEFKTYWNTSTKSTTEKFEDIIIYSRYYNNIYLDENDSPLLEEVLMEYRKNKSVMPAPFLMEMYHLYEQELISARQLSEIIELINIYLVRRWLCNVDTSAITRYFPTLLNLVMTACDGKYETIVKTVRYYLVDVNKNKGAFMPTDEQLETTLMNSNAYILNCIRTVLDKIEHYNNPVHVKLTDLNIEHIMPQKPTKYWLENTDIEEDEYEKYCNLIGNLTLAAVYDNGKMGNNDFAFKKSILASTSHLKINAAILEKQSWDKVDILNRTEEIITLLNTVYPYGETSEKVVVEDRYTIYINDIVQASAILHENGTVEVLAGSEVKAYVLVPKTCSQSFVRMYDEFLDSGIIEIQPEAGKVIFVKNKMFANSNSAAGFILQGGPNVWEHWTYKDGSKVNA